MEHFHYTTAADEKEKRQFEFRRITGKQLAEGHFVLEYAVDNVLVEGQPTLIGGPRKTLKTNAVIDLGISLASSRPFLGKFAVRRQYSVGIMSGESGAPVLQETARRISAAKAVDLAKLPFVMSDQLPLFSSRTHLEALERFIKQDQLEFLVIDPVYRCMGGHDVGNLFWVGDRLNDITRLCQQHGTTLILVHHGRQATSKQFGLPDLSDLSWAGFQEYARQWLLLARRSTYQRDGKHELWLTVGGSAGHSSAWRLDIDEGPETAVIGREWRVEVSPAMNPESERKAHRESQRGAKLKQIGSAIESALADGPETKSKLAELIGRKGVLFEEAFGELFSLGRIKQTKVKRGNDQWYKAFALTLGDSAA